MLVKFLQTVRLRVIQGREEILSRYPVGTIQTLEEAVGKELIEKGVAIEIPSIGHGAPISNRVS
jgi:hypothetical protein